MGKYKFEFPCGLKISENGFFMTNDKELNYLLNFGCPLHGKRCNNNIKQKW